jgi:hypothetical protein
MTPTPEDIQKPRTPSELRAFVEQCVAEGNANPEDLERAFLRKGIYKELRDELSPMARCIHHLYEDTHTIRPILGNQGFDAEVFDNNGQRVDRIEITVPRDGPLEAAEAKKLVEIGMGIVRVTDDAALERLVGMLLETCRKKAQKDYGDATLIVAMNWLEAALNVDEEDKEDFHRRVVEDMSKISFKAKRVFLYDGAVDRATQIGG